MSERGGSRRSISLHHDPGHRGGGGGGGGGGGMPGATPSLRRRPSEMDDDVVMGGGDDDEHRLPVVGVVEDDDDDDVMGLGVEDDEELVDVVDPLTSAIDAMEERVVSTLDEFKLYQKSSSGGSVHDELRELLRPVLEIAAHVGPSTARAHYRYHPSGSIDATVEEIYSRINLTLVLPVLLEVAQSDANAARRGAAVQFFQLLHRECQRPGSYLDRTTGPNSGPTGAGGASAPSSAVGGDTGRPSGPKKTTYSAESRIQMSNRLRKKEAREAELLTYWVDAAAGCVVTGSFTKEKSEEAVASRGILSANAAVRPAMRSIGESVKAADDAGATALYRPLMKMMDGVLNRMLLSPSSSLSANADGGGGDAVRAACVKFVETMVLCFSSRGPRNVVGMGRRKSVNTEDFALEDLPTGHPLITQERLESIGEYAFTTLRGLIKVGGQVKIDTSLLPAGGMFPGAMLENTDDPSSQLVAMLKAAALAFLEVEATIDAAITKQGDSDEKKDEVDVRQGLELDFSLSQKSYALTINALSIAATNRPFCFKDAATALAYRCMDPPKASDNPDDGGTGLSKAGAIAVTSQLKASCLTLLRNPLSVTVGGWEVLLRALHEASMAVQADKAHGVAKQQAALKTAGRAARNRAALFYEWDKSEADRQSKRQRETDDALAQLRAAKLARGLGHGIQLPTNMVEACELVLLNLKNLPENPPGPVASTSKVSRKRPISLEFLVDAVMSNGASLSCDESRWYDRDGGTAWTTDITEAMQNGKKTIECTLDPKTLQRFQSQTGTKKTDSNKKDGEIFRKQCEAASSDAFARIVASSKTSSGVHAQLGSNIAARLAWTLRGVPPPQRGELHESLKFATASVPLLDKVEAGSKSDVFLKEHPLVGSCLALDLIGNNKSGGNAAPEGMSGSQIADNGGSTSTPSSTLANRILYEGYIESIDDRDDTAGLEYDKYKQSLDLFASSIARASSMANEKPNDDERKRIATESAASLARQVSVLPLMTSSALVVASSLCDIDAISKVASDAARKGSHHNLAASAKAHAGKVAAEKRATLALLTLRDIAFQRNKEEARRSAVDCAVGLASGRLKSTNQVQDKALKLVMNVLYPKSNALADIVVASATDELVQATNYSIENHAKVEAANAAVLAENSHLAQTAGTNPLQPLSNEEKVVMEKVRKASVLFMALCVRRPEMIKTLLSNSSREGADVLGKAVRSNMPKLARAVGTKYGAATIALKVADMANETETAMLLSFLDSLSVDAALPNQDLVDAASVIQEQKLDKKGKKDPRFIIPVCSFMKRGELVQRLPEFVGASDVVYKAALRRMGERLGRQALMFRDEPDKDIASLQGMTLCEQLVYLHWMDFNAAGLPQKRYLDAIRLCLDEEDVFTDRVIMSALDYISGKFLSSEEGLPLAYMRTIILTCSKHESLHPWICQILLPRLVEGKVYTDRRQWEGWMRCAKMLERPGEGGASSVDAINKLPAEQLELYRTKYPKKS